jgi:hypothetical protein
MYKIVNHTEKNSQSRLKLLAQNFFSINLIYKCVMDDEYYIMVEGNEWHTYYESKNHPVTEDVKFNGKTKLLAKVLLWLAVSEYGVSEPV